MKAKNANNTMTATRKAPRRRASPILAAVHESISGLHSIGAVSLETMREFDALCLSPVVELAPEQISALRQREHVSQPVFARYLNVSKSSIRRQETRRRGAKAAEHCAEQGAQGYCVNERCTW
jgi:putative transcriptional regulator